MQMTRFIEFGPHKLPMMHNFREYVSFVMSKKNYKSKIRARQIRDSKRK